jgi:hypothetical protein
MAVPIHPAGTTFRQGVAEALFQTGHSVEGGGGRSAYSVSPDGRRFLITRAGDLDRTASVVVVTKLAVRCEAVSGREHV